MINYSNVTFVKSATGINDAPKGQLSEVLIVGKSNVGKSSLINALCDRHRLAFTSSKPGHTKLLNYYLIDNKFYLVDAPGYGYANGGVDLDKLFGEMMENYFSNTKFLKLVLILVDSRREIKDNDKEILDFVNQNQIPYLIVVTKLDKVNQKEKAALVKNLQAADIPLSNIYFTSANESRTLGPLKAAIEQAI